MRHAKSAADMKFNQAQKHAVPRMREQLLAATRRAEAALERVPNNARLKAPLYRAF